MNSSPVTLRPWKISDLSNLVKYANNINIARNLTDMFPHPYRESDGIAFIERVSIEDPVHIFAIDQAGEAIGGMGIHPKEDIYRKNAELGYWLAEPFWGQGIISSLIPQMIEFAFATYDIERLYAGVFSSNIASQKVLEKNNFQLDATIKQGLYKLGELHDELIYSVRRSNFKIK